MTMDDCRPKEVAKRESWGTLPAGPMSPFEYNARFSQHEYAVIRCGLVPEDMDDKRLIFWEDDSLYVHRSWLLRDPVEFKALGGTPKPHRSQRLQLIRRLVMRPTLPRSQEYRLCIETS